MKFNLNEICEIPHSIKESFRIWYSKFICCSKRGPKFANYLNTNGNYLTENTLLSCEYQVDRMNADI